MRLRTLAGVAAGALVGGVLSVPALTTPASAAPVTASTTFEASCSYGSFALPVSGTFAVTVDGQSVTADYDATVNMNAPSLTTSKLGADIDLDIDGESVTVSGERTFSPPAAGTADMELPSLSGTRSGSGSVGAFDITAAALNFTITFGTGTATCTFDDLAPVEFPAQPQPVAKATKSTTKVAYAKKAKKATITTTVKAGKANATGKVKIVVKKGKKTIASKAIALKKGKARLVLKKAKLKAKGKYVVTSAFQKNAKFKASRSKASFRVR